MKRKNTIRIAIGVATVLILGMVASAVHARMSERKGKWVRARKADLVIGVEVTGTLASMDSSQLGPPRLPNVWQYKLSMLAPEGSDIERGRPVIAFDTTELQRDLETKSAEAAEAATSIEKRQADLRLTLEEEQLRLAESEADLRKAALKLEAPDEIQAGNDRAKAELEKSRAEIETKHRRSRIESLKRAAAAEISILRNKQVSAEARVQQIKEHIGRMTVPAPRKGTVVHLSSWRGEKKKAGDTVWGAEKVVEIPDLTKMFAKGEVDESDAGRVSIGQRVTIQLDAHPDIEFTGKISSLAKIVQVQSPQSKLKVLRMDITLDKTDPEKMRPGMRFRGTVELDRVPGTLLVPSEAIEVGPAGPFVRRRTVFGVDEVPVKAGRRNEQSWEILGGIQEGDSILLPAQEDEEEQPS